MKKPFRNRGVLATFLILALVAAMVLGGCQQAAKEQSMTPASAPMEADRLAAQEGNMAAGAGGNAVAERKAMSADESVANAPEPVAGGAAPTQVEALKPQLIRRGNISLEVEKLKEALAKINGLVAVNGGYITNQSLSYQDASGTYRSGQLEVRVPQRNFDGFLEQLQALGKTPGPQITAEDVGKQMSDLQATIRNKQKEEEQLQQIMKRSGKVSEVLEVSRELARVRGEIEQAQSSLQYYKEQVAYSTVTIYVSEKIVGSPTEARPGFGDTLVNAFKSSAGALYNFLLGLSGLLIHLVVFVVPVLAVLGLLLWLIGKAVGRLALRPAMECWRRKRAEAKARRDEAPRTVDGEAAEPEPND